MKKSILLIAAGFLPLALSAQVTVVQWGADNDIVNNFYNSNINSISVNLSAPINPGANVQGYYQGSLSPTGRSAIFYGTVYSTGTTSRLQIPNATPDYMVFDFAGTASDHTYGGIALWQKTDGFLNGYNTAALDFSDVSFSLNTGVNAARNPQQSVHFVVRQGTGDFYVSNRLGDLVGGVGAKIFTQADLTSWSSYDPTTSIIAIGSSANPTLDNITAVGYLFTDIDSSLATASFRMPEFTVTAVPEPATYALLAGLSVLGLVLLRRRSL